MIIMLVAMTAFIGTIGFVKYRQTQGGAAHGSYQPPPEAVTTVTARQEDWQVTLAAIGTVAAVHGVTVSADMPGVVQKIGFKSGDAVEAGQVLVHLDTRQEQAQLGAAEAKLELTRLNLDRIRGLRDQGINSPVDLDTSVAEQKQAEGTVGEIRATIDRKTIRAPFTGILGIRQVNLGQYLESGKPVVPIQSRDPIYIDFAVPQQQVPSLRVGCVVHARGDNSDREIATGRVTAARIVVRATLARRQPCGPSGYRTPRTTSRNANVAIAV